MIGRFCTFNPPFIYCLWSRRSFLRLVLGKTCLMKTLCFLLCLSGWMSFSWSSIRRFFRKNPFWGKKTFSRCIFQMWTFLGKNPLIGKTLGWLALFKVGHWKNPYLCWENFQEKPTPHLGKPVLCPWLLLRLQSAVHSLIVDSVAISASRSGKNLFKENPLLSLRYFSG